MIYTRAQLEDLKSAAISSGRKVRSGNRDGHNTWFVAVSNFPGPDIMFDVAPWVDPYDEPLDWSSAKLGVEAPRLKEVLDVRSPSAGGAEVNSQVGSWLRFPANTPVYDHQYLVLTDRKRLHLAEFWENDIQGCSMWYDTEMGEVDGVVAFCDVNTDLNTEAT